VSNERTPEQIIEVADGFWNIRGSFKIAGLLDVGTHASLVRRKDGSFVLLDACTLSDATRRWIEALTDGGDAIKAVIHLHPFHTVFARKLHIQFPNATLYGTARHAAKLPELPWSDLRAEAPELHALFSDDLLLSVPRGVDFIPANENLHFASVLAIHPASKTLHVDDTLSYLKLPKLLRPLKEDVMMVHPSLAQVLERRAGAVADFRSWTRELVESCRDVDNLCAAHSSTLLARDNHGAPIVERVQAAFDKVDGKLRVHQRKYG
jgi:hypothetical protein